MGIHNNKENSSKIKPLKKAVHRFIYVLIPLILLLAVGKFDLLAKEVYDAGILLAASLLFILGIPLSLILGVDKMQYNLGIESNELSLILASFVVLLNFIAYGLFFSFFKKKSKKEKND